MAKRRWIRVLVVVVVVLGTATTGLLVSGWAAFGATASGERRAVMEASPQWGDGVFENPQPMYSDLWGSVWSVTETSEAVSPDGEVPVVTDDGSRFAEPPETGLRVTWFGHSSALVEIDGARFLLDPVWGERASPFSWVGPKRWYPPPVALEDLPNIDAVLISHDHYDHLDHPTVLEMTAWDTMFVVPLGVGAHLEYWGIAAERITELDWWETTEVAGTELVALPSRHASGRFVNDYMSSLWAGFALIGPQHRVYYSGDTGMFPAMHEIGEKYGPFDVTMIEVGAYHRAWPDWHIGPEQAVEAHEIVRGKVFLPVHWGMWTLAMHGWTEPAERVVAAAEKTGTVLAMPRPGESVEPARLRPVEKWWPSEPWDTAEEHPIRSTRLSN